MKTLLLRFVLAAAIIAASIAVAPMALAQEHGEEESAGGGGTSFVGGPDWDAVKEVTIWSMVSIAGGSALLGVFYLFKRKVGGFPENPAWVAPITIMPASQLPGDDTADGDSQDSHASHAPAH